MKRMGSMQGGRVHVEWTPAPPAMRGSSSVVEHSHAQAHRTIDAAMAPPSQEHHLEMVPEGTRNVPWVPPGPAAAGRA